MKKSNQCVIFLIFIFSICNDITMAADSPCGDWEPYKDEKCFKIIDETLRPYDDAEKACSQQESSATLGIIHSKEEQDFLSNLLFKTHKVLDNVWIGVKYTINKFKWTDNSDLSFTNWAEGSPSNKTNYECVQIMPESSPVGKWVDEPCGKKNLVVCQKMQTWSISRLQKTFLDFRKELQQNPVPKGFIYVQLPSQPEPMTLWSMVEWKDVTSDYAGLFFRAEGGGSAAFEKLQNENVPSRYISSIHSEQQFEKYDLDLSIGGWSKKIYTGDGWTTNTACGMRFQVTENSGEVRPRNKAIRIWKRTK